MDGVSEKVELINLFRDAQADQPDECNTWQAGFYGEGNDCPEFLVGWEWVMVSGKYVQTCLKSVFAQKCLYSDFSITKRNRNRLDGSSPIIK